MPIQFRPYIAAILNFKMATNVICDSTQWCHSHPILHNMCHNIVQYGYKDLFLLFLFQIQDGGHIRKKLTWHLLVFLEYIFYYSTGELTQITDDI